MLKRSKKLHFGFILTTVAITMIVVTLGFLHYRALMREREQISRSHMLMQNLSGLLAEFERLEALIHESEKEPYPQVMVKYLDIATTLQFQLSQLVTSKSGTLLYNSNFDTLQAKSNVYLDKYQALLAMKYEPRPEKEWASYYLSLADVGMLSFISKWSRQEGERLSDNLNSSQQMRDALLWAAIILLVAMVVYHIIYRRIVMDEFSRCDDAILQNQINSDVFEYIEKMAGMGHAYYNFKEKKLFFSANLYRILGYTPSEDEPSFRMYLRRIYSPDLKSLLEKLKSLTLVKGPAETSVRMMLPEGDIRNVRLLGLIRNDEQGRIAVFVTKDVTSEITSQEMLKELNANLSLQNRLFRHVESVASIGYYTYILDSDSQLFSENLFRLLGFSPDSFTPSKKILLSHVLDEDREVACSWTDPESEFDDRQKVTIKIRDRYDAIKYLSLSREFFEDENVRILVVTFKDVSVEAAINRNLENKNLELFRSNAELESFNHIASHDLQEPIRKIQTLLSMLKSLPDLHMPEKGEDYLRRIKRSASRMQLLILDLLKFSSVSNVSKEFEIASLNTLAEAVLDELSLKIAEKGAEVNVSWLPEASVIPSQIQQLFTNLIENALKFGDQERKTIVNIFTEEVSDYEKSLFPPVDRTNLLKISVQDNGIGFDPNHAETIFIIFNRLHDNQDFGGSGIGLAICKKVVENHGGIIFANGIPGEGSRFTFIISSEMVETASRG